MLVSVGSNITSNADALQKASVDTLYYALRNPKPHMQAKIRQLHIVKEINPNQYTQVKKQLPYFVCAMFNPPFRRTENFAYTELFIVDLDHLTDKQINIQELKNILKTDNRVLLLFTSPSQDGLKVMFKLTERCYDAGIYKLFYKTFVREFAKKYNLQQVVDERTSDVCRACFMSIDVDAHYNPLADEIDLKQYIEVENVAELSLLKMELEKENKKVAEEQKDFISTDTIPNDPDAKTLSKIKEILGTTQKKIKPTEKFVFIPQELEQIINDLKNYIEETGLIVTEIINIQYAKKIRVKMGVKQAEINLFYGKKGFTVVQSPRNGTSADLNQLVAELVESFLGTL
jgi:hypothetical protein